jgi:hypothetical protein
VYDASIAGTRLYQGEILSNIVERTPLWVARDEAGDVFAIDEMVHPFAVVVTQDCDLEQDERARLSQDKDDPKRQKALLRSILLVVASEFESAKDFGGSDIKKRVKQNKDERFQYLVAVPSSSDSAGSGVPSLVLDFKRFFTYPANELLRVIASGETVRRARLVTPYVEHVSDRFGFFTQRIGLPRDHHDCDHAPQAPSG